MAKETNTQGTTTGSGMSGALGGTTKPEDEESKTDLVEPTLGSSSTTATIGGSSSTKTSAPVKAMPKQQKAGTGTFANLKSYLQAAQGGGQQRVAQAAAQKIESAATGAQRNIQQAQDTFRQRMDAASLANRDEAGADVSRIIEQARATTYQAPQPAPQTTPEVAPQVEGEQAPQAQPQTPTQPQQYISPEDQQRFAEIINAQYQGPQSLQEAGLYEQAASRARAAQTAVDLSRTAAGREQLLKDIFSRGRDYSRGASKLDALLLNASEQGVGQVQQAAEKAGDVRQVLQQAQNLSANEATNRAKAIQDIATGARTAFTEGRTAEEQATEKRIDDMIKTPAKDESGNPIQKLDAEGKPMVDAEGKPVYMTEWERLPEYFRNVLRTSPETNKKMQEEGIKKLEESTGLSGKRFDELPGQISQIQKKIAQLQRDIPEGSRTPGSASAAQQSRMRNQINQLSQSLKNLQGEYASYKDFGEQLKSLRNIDPKQVRLSQEEMDVLGVGSGEGLYGLGQGLISDVEARRENLITKDELSRQLALSQLAGLDVSKQLQKDLAYTDLEKAGTQDLTSSLDVKGIREKIDAAQKSFKEAAESANLVGTGTKKVSRGNWSGKRTKTYSATQAGNVADMLREAGYDVSAESPEAIKSILTDKDALANYLGATSTSRSDSGSMYAEGGARTAAGAATGAGIGAYFGSPWIGAGIGGAVGSVIGNNSTLANVVGDLGGGRMSSSAMAQVGRGTAKELAIKNLQKQYKDFLEGQGFSNRIVGSQDQEVMSRVAGLQALLNRKA